MPTTKPRPGSLAAKVAGVKVPPQRQGLVWKGPLEDGITFSLLSKFLVCRERFRLLVIEGWKTADKFNHLMEYGNMWHVCEENLAAGGDWAKALTEYGYELIKRYPLRRADVEHWYKMCMAQFPHYVHHWAKHPDVKERTPLMQEETFTIRYVLPSGREVKLRGKYDAVDVIGKGKDAGIYLQENKTKSQVDPTKIGRQVTYDLQSMLYIISLKDKHASMGWAKLGPIAGVRYNVVRRPAHKSPESMCKKIDEDIIDRRIGEWFGRWRVEISDLDIARFKKETFDPILEQLYDWWETQTLGVERAYFLQLDRYKQTKFISPCHFRYPYGIYHILNEGGTGDLDVLLNEGSKAGLKQVDTLFPELETKK